jgi:hypothetical protein
VDLCRRRVADGLNEAWTEAILCESKNSDLRYLSFEEVRETHETVQCAGPLQQAF